MAITWPKQSERIEFAQRPLCENRLVERPTAPERERVRKVIKHPNEAAWSDTIRQIGRMHPYDSFRFINACSDLVFLLEVIGGGIMVRRAGLGIDAAVDLVHWLLRREFLFEDDSPLSNGHAKCSTETHGTIEELVDHLVERQELEFILAWYVPGFAPRLGSSFRLPRHHVLERLRKALRSELGIHFRLVTEWDRSHSRYREAPRRPDGRKLKRKPSDYAIPVLPGRRGV